MIIRTSSFVVVPWLVALALSACSKPEPATAPFVTAASALAGAVATQSSTLEGAGPERAIDGNPDGRWSAGSVSHTQSESRPWWQVDLGASRVIHSVDLFNRTDCCGERLSNYYVFVSDTPFTSTDPDVTKGQPQVWSVFLREQAGSPARISVGRSGRYVRVQLAETNYLSIAEVRFDFEGMAPTATQSSTLEGGDAARAIDGNTDGAWANGSVTHTNAEANAWWQVDLHRIQVIRRLELFNRADCCAERLSDYWVFVSDDPFLSADLNATIAQPGVWSVHLTATAGRPTTIDVQRTGAFVRVQLAGTNYLSLAEVRITADPPGPLATQSSTLEGGVAVRAIDGVTDGTWADGSVTHTQSEPNAWWQVDLGSVRSIGAVKLWNRTDCCASRLSDYDVLVSDAPFQSSDLQVAITQPGVWWRRLTPAAGAPTQLVVGRTGRFVRVQLAGTDYLSLAEVQVRDGACRGNGLTDATTGACLCDLGYAGTACSACAPGYTPVAGGCALAVDGSYTEWPNPASKANSDPWLPAHHAGIRVLEPRVLALNFANPSQPANVNALLTSIMAAYAEGSRVQGAGTQQLQYQLAKPVVDLRDGAGGRPPPPPGYPYENSTLLPRRPASEPGYWRLDYATFFEQGFAQYYGYPDPGVPGRYLTLCELAERGEIHELWFVGSGDVPDVNAAEVLEAKPVYTAAGNRITGAVNRCSGNGCFDPDVPACAASLRIGFVNYNRGPGCYVHSLGHGLEWTANQRAVPALSEWFPAFTRLDLDTRHGFPIRDWYGLSCANPPCISFPTPSSVLASHGGAPLSASPYDGACGSVHFPPNGRQPYDYGNPDPVLSSCVGFGRHQGAGGADLTAPVSSADWAAYQSLAPDCGGEFLVWWHQNMPGYGSGQRFFDGRSMLSVWPYRHY